MTSDIRYILAFPLQDNRDDFAAGGIPAPRASHGSLLAGAAAMLIGPVVVDQDC
jgi:hypothetical protein